MCSPCQSMTFHIKGFWAAACHDNCELCCKAAGFGETAQLAGAQGKHILLSSITAFMFMHELKHPQVSCRWLTGPGRAAHHRAAADHPSRRQHVSQRTIALAAVLTPPITVTSATYMPSLDRDSCMMCTSLR